jgi:hypothetical protein
MNEISNASALSPTPRHRVARVGGAVVLLGAAGVLAAVIALIALFAGYCGETMSSADCAAQQHGAIFTRIVLATVGLLVLFGASALAARIILGPGIRLGWSGHAGLAVLLVPAWPVTFLVAGWLERQLGLGGTALMVVGLGCLAGYLTAWSLMVGRISTRSGSSPSV